MDKSEFIRLFQSYEGISVILKSCAYGEIVSLVSELVSISSEELENSPMGGYSKGKTSGVYHFVLEDLLRNVDSYDWLYKRLADDKSKEVFTRLMQFRLIPDVDLIKQAYDGVNHQYFDKSIVSCDANEVFVDCGGFVGDTAEDYIRQYGNYKKIYVYEPSGDNIESCRKNLEKYRDIIVKRCGVGEKSAKMAMDVNKASSIFVNAAQGQEAIEIVSLDEDIREKVTFIKMDVEGFEIPAIIGAKNHIKNDNPKLAICTYHIISDMWEIPKLIDAINKNYRFYLRHYYETQNWETVLYAIPSRQANGNHKVISAQLYQGAEKKNMALSERRRKVVAMAPYERGWSNVELIKDCGLIPYLLYKNHNCEVTMVGADSGPYPYLEKFINGVKMEFLPNGEIEEKARYIINNAKEIDALILRGCYPTNFSVAELYKQINPSGRIYVGLDANSEWMDRIEWYDEEFVKFMNCCDVIATSCVAMQNFLNEKWPWKVEHIPNGWYDFLQEHKKPNFEKKKNIILTVGRLGTRQKATEVLLEAFSQIADKIPDWTVCLVGGVEQEFQGYIKRFHERFPHLAERIRFMGAISDRKKLFEEYDKAKIFALPSTFEGGTPNVIAEALHAGCVTAVTKFDAYEEATDYGRCGLASDKGNVEKFAEILYRLCTAENLKQFSEHACQYGRRHFDMENIVARLNEMLFGGGVL